MRLIIVKAFLARENLIREGKRVDRRAKVLDFGDDEVTEYAILSHRWVTEQEVDYDEMVGLAKMDVEERDEIRQRDGYQKILQSCKQAQEDGYDWLWVDTCCIDKRSSAELSEAINSMYRWYENAKVCYAYLHDVPGSSLPTVNDKERYPDFRGWPEWFSRGIGDKRTLAPTLHNITGIPEDILTLGLDGNRPCVAQIMSWAAHRTTTRVEDRAYSLMGLLDVNMPMLYGEGKKAFHRLQLEIIRASNDQSIFAWHPSGERRQPGSILADDPRDFANCGTMELMDHDEFIEFVKKDVPEEELDSIEDRLGSFPVTNRGIQIWLLLSPDGDLFQVRLPCRAYPLGPPVTITVVLWESNHYKWPMPLFAPIPPPKEPQWQLRQVYLRYQVLPHRDITFEIDDSALTENGFTCCAAYPEEYTGNTLTMTSDHPLCVKVYSDSLTNRCFVVGLGQSFGKDWIHVFIEIPQPSELPAMNKYWCRAPKHALQMNEARSGAQQVCIMQTRLPQTTRILQISSIKWKSSRRCGVKLEVFHDPGFSDVSGHWTAFHMIPSRGLMIFDRQNKCGSYAIDEVPSNFSDAPDGIKLGDYGHFTNSEEFCREGNLFTDLDPLSLIITPRQYRIYSVDYALVCNLTNVRHLNSLKPVVLSLPSDDNLKSLLNSFSTRLTNKYLVTKVTQYFDYFLSRKTRYLCDIAKPYVWYRNESAGSTSEERSGDGLRAETEGDEG
ncbi:hypothetical protein SCLCIDRAFT_20314 [Scleroderma citrinum Foug A]|uniref:Heterokaryon incompatibility domain-containing protein n=1 Tax=Scleroderma citrinum Foug A TaxID=1036808 RepID=A0A0C3EKE4_9AGAM|nr:hypothetical protein SCLCIDRAFT_20314 [Scleroderma citrinum Foug A]